MRFWRQATSPAEPPLLQGKGKSVPHLEIVEVEGVDIPQMDVFHLRRRRAALQALDELLDRRLVALDVHVHPAIRAIAHPARHAKLVSLVLRPCTEEHALHPPGHADVPGDAHHTVEMSGASSAFMPTTL